MDKYFAPETGRIFSCFPGAEERLGQRKMAELVWDTIQDASKAMDAWKNFGGAPDEKPDGFIQAIEAGTGIGKSLGYLIPAIAAGRVPIIVATRTKQLQRQLLEDDLPRAKGILGQEIKAVLAKGRSNYLCRTAWGLAQVRPPAELSASDFGLWEALPYWSEETSTGDREELGRHAEGDSALWGRLNGERCIGGQCPNKDRCFLTKLRRELFEADLIIVNTALLLADRILREEGPGQLLPDAPVLILDEAHEIEDQLTDSCAEQWSSWAMALLFRDLEEMASHEPEGVLATMHMLPWEQAWQDLLSLVPKDAASFALTDPRLDFGPLADAVVAWINAGQAVYLQVKLLAEQKREAEQDNAMGIALWRQMQGRISKAFRRMELIFAQPEAWVSTIAREGPAMVLFKASPIDVKPFFHKYLRRGFESLVMTSATLRDGSGFNGLKLRLGFSEEEAGRGALVESPFDFERQGMLFVPPGIPLRRAGQNGVGDPAWIDASTEAMSRLLIASRGRALLLFTSRKMLSAFSLRLKSAMPSLTLFVQGEGLSRAQLLSRFRKTPNSALLGVASFWQGIDLPGKALSLVVVAALPFAPPDDPVIQARINEADAIRPGLGFLGIQVPQMALKLKQGIGRLIRTRTDRGVVCVLDPRLMLPSEDHLGKSYAAQARATLPPFPLTRDWERVEEFLREI
jgi:ATP-dependent DNA helicase DinG